MEDGERGSGEVTPTNRIRKGTFIVHTKTEYLK